MKKDSPLKAFVIAGHFFWIIVSPILIFIVGGSWLINRFNWDNRIMLVFILVALAVIVISAWSYFKQMLSVYDDEKPPPKTDKRDYDY